VCYNYPTVYTRLGRSEAEHTRTLISHGLEISIAGGGADEKDVLLSDRLCPYVIRSCIPVSLSFYTIHTSTLCTHVLVQVSRS